MNIDPYEILGVSKDASKEDIRKAYRQLARKHHPDVNAGNKEAEEKFKQLSEAYDILGDPAKREEYDRLGQQAFYKEAFGGTGYQRPDFSSGFSFEDLFGDLFGGRTGRAGNGGGVRFDYSTIFEQGGAPGSGFATGPQKGGDLNYRLTIGLRDAVFGTETTLEYERPQLCSACQGQGMVISSGQAAVCSACQGRGQTGVREKLKAKIPAGVDAGSKVRLAGKGHPGLQGGPPGDLYLEIEIAPDAVFSRNGRDISIDLDINLFDAVLGGKKEVPTLYGRAMLTIPPGTQNGAKLRLKGQGIKGVSGKPAGDQYVTIKVLIPKNLSNQAKEEFVKLKNMMLQ